MKKKVVTLIRSNRPASIDKQRRACNAFALEHGLLICKEFISDNEYEFDFQAQLPKDPIMHIRNLMN